VVSDQGTFPLRADKIRWALRKGNGSNSILPSTCFDLEIIRGEDDSIKQVIARGRGNGHGVGMCQTGAIGMARAGYSYRDILLHYYTGVKITQCY
jgi:stage II sporulation protein D